MECFDPGKECNKENADFVESWLASMLEKGQVNPEASICVNSRWHVSKQRWWVSVGVAVLAHVLQCRCEPYQQIDFSMELQNRAWHDQIQKGSFWGSMNSLCKFKSDNSILWYIV